MDLKKVYILWDDGDYYGPDLVGIYTTEEAAEKAKEKMPRRFIGYVSDYELPYEEY